MYKVIDCDRHVNEPLEMWREYVDPEIFQHTPVYMSQESVEVDGKTVCIDQPMIGKWPVNGNWHVKIRTAAAMMDRDGKQEQIDAMHPITQLAAMDRAKVATAYLLPSFALIMVNHEAIEPHVSVEYAMAYNRWAKDYVDVCPGE